MLALRNRHLLPLDALLLTATPMIAYAIRFEGFTWSARDAHAALLYTALSVPLKLGIFLSIGIYRRLWRYIDIADVEQLIAASVASGSACAVLGILVLQHAGLSTVRVPISVLFLDGFLTVTVLFLPRMLAKVLGMHHPRSRDQRHVLIAGAGTAGESIVRELRANPQLGLNPVGFVDDDRRKHHHRLCALPVLGSLSQIRGIVAQHDVREIIIAMPSAPGTVMRRIVDAARDVGVPTRTVPGLFEILSGRVGITKLRQVEIHDLLRRAPVKTDLDGVRSLVGGHIVMVTGAGGSIGSELCRQIASFDPAGLVLLGHGEHSIFEIANELRDCYADLHIIPVIADIRDRARLGAIFARYGPYTVFHAAAHKHVPLMEENIAEAITNNVLGTRTVVRAAVAAGTRHLVMISTDKAVHPSSVMGATKRAAELIVQHAAAVYGCTFVSVRFGNVLGSRGSVLPTFLRQIRTGGPVTVTHPEMRRFFMMIPEAVQLALQAGALGHGGEVFVLDMGEPVRIVDLATDLIRLSGFEVGDEIALAFTGLRPGEKLIEELFFSGECATPTCHPKVLMAQNVELAAGIIGRIDSLIDAAVSGCPDAELRRLLRAVVPYFVAPQASATEVDRTMVHQLEREVQLAPPVVVADRAVASFGALPSSREPIRPNGGIAAKDHS